MQQLEALRKGDGHVPMESEDIDGEGSPSLKRHRASKPKRSSKEEALWATYEESLLAQVQQALQAGEPLPDLTSATQQLAQKLAALYQQAASGAAAAPSADAPPPRAAQGPSPGGEEQWPDTEDDLYATWEDEQLQGRRARAPGPYTRPPQPSQQSG